MSNVASLELCKELYELSRWGKYGETTDENPAFYWEQGDDFDYDLSGGSHFLPKDGGIYPAYDLGYLLRKLPSSIPTKTTEYFFQMAPGVDAKWQIDYRDINDGQYTAVVADTPENACAKLAIELFKANILKPEGRA
jgi:hypothetical protein